MMKKKQAIILSLFLVPWAAAAETLQLGSSGGSTANVEVERRLQLAVPPANKSLGGFLSCETPSSGQGSPSCPLLAATFTSRDLIEPSPELKSLWASGPTATAEAAAPAFRLEQNVLHYAAGKAEFTRDIGSYFLPGTRIVRQWPSRSPSSDVLFVLSETCDDQQGCRSGLWLFVVPKSQDSPQRAPAFRASLLPLPAKIDESRLGASPRSGIYSAAARVAVVLPTESGTIAVAWVADLEIRRTAAMPPTLLFEIYPIFPLE